jgi:phospholipid/cholesterol/gamma-HCH transport system substrate-binding protein
MAPIVKNREYNFLPLATNVFVGATTRPNELTYSEDWMRPDYIPPQPPPGAAPPADAGGAAAPPPPGPPLPAEAPIATNPADGLQGLMVPQGAGS